MNRIFQNSASILVGLSIALIGSIELRGDDRRPLDHDSYDQWNAIGQTQMSPDGRWFVYSLQAGKSDSLLHIRDTHQTQEFKIKRGRGAKFSHDSQFLVLMVDPDPAAVKKAAADKVAEPLRPKAEMVILELASGNLRTIPRVRSFSLPEKSSGWLAYLLLADPEPQIMTRDAAAATDQLIQGPSGLIVPFQVKEEPADPVAATQETEKKETQAPPNANKSNKSDKSDKSKTKGATLVIEQMSTGRQWRYPWVTQYTWNKPGNSLAWITSAPSGDQDGVWMLDLEFVIEPHQIVSGLGNYASLTFDEAGQQLAFATDRDDYKSKQPAWSLMLWSGKLEEPCQVVVNNESPGIPSGSIVQANSPVSFSKQGRRLFFNTTINDDIPESKSTTTPSEEPQAKLDLWHWSEPILQTVQLAQLNRLRQRNFQAVYHIAEQQVIQLATEETPNVNVADEGDADIGLMVTNEPYRLLSTWESPGFQDVWLINVKTGKRDKVLERIQAQVQISPSGRYVVWWDGAQQHWFGMSTRQRQPLKLTEKITTALYDEDHDTPNLPGSYGSAGWSDGERHFWIYDRYDLWQIDPTGKSDPICLTDGQGRADQIRYRRLRLDPDERTLNPKQPHYLSAFSETNKGNGYWKMLPAKSSELAYSLESLIMLDESLGQFTKATSTDDIVLTRQTFRRFPDYWKSDLEFKSFQRLTHANPQQNNYRWGSAELVTWENTNGHPLEGLLYKPDGFDATQQYPLMVYYYERNANNLHRYYVPAAGRSTINISFYVSRGYVVFVPDIVYETGAPGPSAMACIMPGVDHLIEQGFIDADRMGLQGHSWGGYQTAYIVTQTDRFAAAEAGAPVSNMTSAYGGIRWASGLSRMFQYERTQSRIGQTLWEDREAYINNSPLFFADRIQTPLLILHNDNDGAVPWYQGIELFMALRRLERPAWLVNYNDDAHGITKEENRRDFAIRMQQFFDHYLQDAPPAEWMVRGIPAVEKGKSFGLELVPGESTKMDEARETGELGKPNAR